jgi:dimethylargininase
MFRNAIVRTPSSSMADGITSADLGAPDRAQALSQHKRYVATLERCGLEVTVLPPEDDFPDATFVEDCAIVTERCAVITLPGAPSRRGERHSIREALRTYYDELFAIQEPGTLDGGDVMRVGNHFTIGLSQRTNREGARQLSGILDRFGYVADTLPLARVLHLKTGLSYLENGNLLVCGEFIDHPGFNGMTRLVVPEGEAYAANSLWINGRVLVPEGFERTRELIRQQGYPVEPLAMSEFRKMDGGLSCLSLRF